MPLYKFTYKHYSWRQMNTYIEIWTAEHALWLLLHWQQWCHHKICMRNCDLTSICTLNCNYCFVSCIYLALSTRLIRYLFSVFIVWHGLSKKGDLHFLSLAKTSIFCKTVLSCCLASTDSLLLDMHLWGVFFFLKMHLEVHVKLGSSLTYVCGGCLSGGHVTEVCR